MKGPSDEEREALLDALGEVIHARGADFFLTAPLRTATPRDFPDEWAPDVEGVRLMALRLMRHAGLDGLDAEVIEQIDEDEEVGVEGPPSVGGQDRSFHREGAVAWFMGIEDGIALFGIEPSQLSDAEQLAGTVAHEVAHAYRRHHALVVEDRDLEEQLTDLTTVYLGFGVLTANAADRYRSSGGLDGAQIVTQWRRQQSGYLSAATMSFLLAAQVAVRAGGRAERRQVKAALELNQGAAFSEALGWLDDRIQAVRERLCVPPDPPPVRARDDAEARPMALERRPVLDGPGTSPSSGEEADARSRRNAGEPIFGVARSGMELVPAGLAGLVAGAAVGMFTGNGWALLVLPLACAAIQRWGFGLYCTGCDHRFGGSSPDTCPGCGGVLVRTLAHRGELSEAEERYWAERPGQRQNGRDLELEAEAEALATASSSAPEK